MDINTEASRDVRTAGVGLILIRVRAIKYPRSLSRLPPMTIFNLPT